jgi:hypothetical protein
MADTYAAMYRELLQFVPNLPVFLARKLINERYRQVMESRPWSGLRGEGIVTVPDAYTTGTVDVVQGSTSFTGHGTTWTSGMIGRQFKVNARGPQLTILTVPSATSLTTDLGYPLASATGQNFSIQQCYITMAANFKRFVVVYDALRQWRLFFNWKVEELASMDPARTSIGDPWLIVDYKMNTSGQPMYELWPSPSIARGYSYLCFNQATDLVNDTDTPLYPLRGSEIVYGALADACRWPGTSDFPNPLFEKAQLMLPAFEGKFREALNVAEREDENIFLNYWSRPEFSDAPYAPLDSKFMQSHAIQA